MKLVAVTYGTEGDTRPLAALCRALIEAGHDVQLLAAGATLGTASALGVPAMALAGDIQGTLAHGSTRALVRLANANTASWLRSVVAAGRGCDAIIVSGLAGFVGLSAAEALGVTSIGTGLIPITPTAAFPSPFLPPGLTPRWFNRASHLLVNGLLWRAFRRATNAARATVCGLAPRRAGWSRHAMLYGVSPALVPPPADWPDNARLCGQWQRPVPDWSPPAALTDFLGAGDKPIYVGFGSMAGMAPPTLLKAVVTAVAGRRAVLYPGWSRIDPAALPGNFCVIGETPHDWLFPRVALAIHHGGSGTSHSAARAGIPSVVVPFAGDQWFWADRLRRGGAAGEPVSVRHLTASALARGIAVADHAEMHGRAAALGTAMAAETGLTDTVSAIEALVGGN